MKITLLLLAVLGFSVFGQNVANILIYHDNFAGYGSTVATAASSLWPAANIQTFTGEPDAEAIDFNIALEDLCESWDIIIVESWYADGNAINWDGIKDLYDTGAAVVYASTWQWNSFTSGQGALGNSMGVASFDPFGSASSVHYAWNPGHPICNGIADWGWTSLGLGISQCEMTVSDAVPVTGWASSPTAGKAGICVANDGSSVISGYTLAYSNENVALWTNILNFMWNSLSPLQRDSWAGIKTSF